MCKLYAHLANTCNQYNNLVEHTFFTVETKSQNDCYCNTSVRTAESIEVWTLVSQRALEQWVLQCREAKAPEGSPEDDKHKEDEDGEEKDHNLKDK